MCFNTNSYSKTENFTSPNYQLHKLHKIINVYMNKLTIVDYNNIKSMKHGTNDT